MTVEDEKAIVVQDLHKKFDEIYAVRGVSLSVRRGEIFSLLGPNGAGKSTVISMLAGLLEPTAGDAFVMGHSITKESMEVKALIGVVPQEIALYEDLSARENLEFWGKMYGLRGNVLRQRVDQILEMIGLVDRQKGPVNKFSGGMKRRLNIGIALLHTPDVVIMDEPTVGIDPQSRRNILDSVKALNREGMTVLYTTHYMEEAQELSDHIAIMDRGEVIAQGTHAELVKIVGELDRIDLTVQVRGGGAVEPESLALPARARVPGQASAGGDSGTTAAADAGSASAQLIEAWRQVEGVRRVVVEDGNAEAEAPVVSLLVEDSNLVLPRLFELANQSGARITSVEIQEPNLEAVFLHLTGRALRD